MMYPHLYSKQKFIIVTYRYGVHVPTEYKYVIISYTSITQFMVDSQCEIMWANNSGAGLGGHPISYYESAPYSPENQAIITQQGLGYNIIGLWIKNFLTTDAKCKLDPSVLHTYSTTNMMEPQFF